MISKLIILCKQLIWPYKLSKFHYVQIKIENKAFASEMCHSQEIELELVSAESDVRSGRSMYLKNKRKQYVKINRDTTSEQVLALLDAAESDE